MKYLSGKRFRFVFLTFVVMVIVVNLIVQRSQDSESKCRVPEPSATYALASELLCGLVVEKEHIDVPYERELFFYGRDSDGDGHSTRSEILLRDSTVEVQFDYRNGSSHIVSGAWHSPLDAKSYLASSDVEVDHLVPLKEAWHSGAWRWSSDELRTFANDLEYPTLIVVSTSMNRSKGQKDFAEWTPANAKCWYAQMWILVKFRWNLTVDVLEKSALVEVLDGGCGSISLKLNYGD